MPCFSSRGRCEHGRDRKGWLEGWLGQCKWLRSFHGDRKFVFISVHVSLCVNMHLGSEVARPLELKVQVAVNCSRWVLEPTQVLWKSSKYIQLLNHISRAGKGNLDYLPFSCSWTSQTRCCFFFSCDDLKKKKFKGLLSAAKSLIGVILFSQRNSKTSLK